MQPITSPHNETIKQLKQLATSSKKRRLHGQTLAEGIHLAQSYLDLVGLPVKCVYTEAALQDAEAASIIKHCQKHKVDGIVISEANFRSVSSLKNGIGLMFVISIPKSLNTKLLDGALLLENVQDPGNMGAVMRVAAAAGIKNIYSSSGCTSSWSPKVLRAAMGANFTLNIHEDCNLKSLIESNKINVLATSLAASETIYQQDLTQPTAWLFGNEGQGVSDELLNSNVKQVIIPQNTNIDSLNIATATAVCLFEQVRQRLR